MAGKSGPDWGQILDFARAVDNLGREAPGDWHRDPWSWPEHRFLLKEGNRVVDRLNTAGVSPVALVDVPKENFAARPAMVMEPLDRLAYTALVDYLSKSLIGNLAPQAFGWRLPVDNPVPGQYARNKDEWERFRRHLAESANQYDAALLTDIVSCFASVPVGKLRDSLEHSLPKGRPLERLLSFLEGWGTSSGRSGLPQRSSASAVLANAYLRNFDLILQAHANRVGKAERGAPKSYSWARWMDDMWLFGPDAGRLRKAQVELQHEAAGLGLNLNSSKTVLLEGPEVVQRALELEHSAIDDELIRGGLIALLPEGKRKKIAGAPMLNELLDRIISGRETASRTSVRFATTRMRTYEKLRRVPELLEVAHRMPHCADHLGRLFRESVGVAAFQDWFLEYVKSPWSSYEWSIANFGTALKSSGRVPRRATRDYFAEAVATGRTSLPLFALAAQRLSVWDPDACRLAVREAVKVTTSPHHLRVAAFAALTSGEQRPTVRRWLAAPENRLTLDMLEATAFRVPNVSQDYLGDRGENSTRRAEL